MSPDGYRCAVLGTDSMRVLGGVIPAGDDEAARLTGLQVVDGRVRPLDDALERRVLAKFPRMPTPAAYDANAAAFWRALHSHGVVGVQRSTWWDFLTTDAPFRVSATMAQWLAANPTHPRGSNLLQWTESALMRAPRIVDDTKAVLRQ